MKLEDRVKVLENRINILQARSQDIFEELEKRVKKLEEI